MFWIDFKQKPRQRIFYKDWIARLSAVRTGGLSATSCVHIHQREILSMMQWNLSTKDALNKGHLLLSQSHRAVYKSISELGTPLHRTATWVPIVSAIERFHCNTYTPLQQGIRTLYNKHINFMFLVPSLCFECTDPHNRSANQSHEYLCNQCTVLLYIASEFWKG